MQSKTNMLVAWVNVWGPTIQASQQRMQHAEVQKQVQHHCDIADRCNYKWAGHSLAPVQEMLRRPTKHMKAWVTRHGPSIKQKAKDMGVHDSDESSDRSMSVASSDSSDSSSSMDSISHERSEVHSSSSSSSDDPNSTTTTQQDSVIANWVTLSSSSSDSSSDGG